MLRCRLYGHAWDEFYPIDLARPVAGWRLSLRCTRCTTERHDLIGRTGDLEGRRYAYPEDYRDAPRLDRSIYRKALYSKIKDRLDQSAVNLNGGRRRAS